MRQRKLIDVSTMGDTTLSSRPSSSRPDSNNSSRRCSKRPSTSSGLAPRRTQSLSVSADFRPDTTSKSISTTFGGSIYAQRSSLTTNDRLLDCSLFPSNGGSRLTSGNSQRTMSSLSTARSRSKMTTTASSLRASTVCSKGSFSDSIGSHPGLTVWVLENRRHVQISRNCHGFFHEGNGYLILKVTCEGSKYIHVWIGSKSDSVDLKALQSQAENLDKHVKGANFLSIESEGHETDTFLEHFQDGLVIVEGKTKLSMKSATAYTKRLYILRGRRFPIATCAPCSMSALASDRALILDGFPRIYVWLGPDVDNVTRVKAIQVAHKIRDYQRKGVAHIIVIDKKETNLHEAFIRKLHAEGEEGEEEETFQTFEEDSNPSLRLYRINGDRPLYDMPYVAEKPLQHKYLTSKDCFLLVRGHTQPVFIWIGANADTTALDDGIRRAQIFTHHYNYPSKTAVCRITEGDEPPSFKSSFSDWSDRTVKQRQLARTYNVANIGRALYSGSDCRTIAQMSEVWSDDQFLKGHGATEVWRISNDKLQARVWDQPGIFNNCHSYIILYQESTAREEDNKTIVYYWLGCKSSKDSHKAAFDMVIALDRALQHKLSVVRVLDGMEPKHFLTIFHYSMLVYDGDLGGEGTDDIVKITGSSKEDDHDDEEESDVSFQDQSDQSGERHKGDTVSVFRVRECVPGCMRVLQVSPFSCSFNSSAAYIVYTNTSAFVWYGKNASANEREYSKSMLDNLRPNKLHQYDIVNEGREPETYWELITKNGDYPAEFPKQLLHRRPARLHLYVEASSTFWNVEQFSQEDLNETDVFILDTFDQLFLWCGKDFGSENCEILLSIFEAYLEADHVGRRWPDTLMWFVNQGFEPEVFTKHFPSWDEVGYGGVMTYESARKWARQENAAIDIDCQMVDRTYTCTAKLSFRELVKGIYHNIDVDIHRKEHHLTDKEFSRVLQMNRAKFYRLPEWKQTQILRSSNLKRTSLDDAPPVWSVDSGSSHTSMDLTSIIRKKLQTATPHQLDR